MCRKQATGTTLGSFFTTVLLRLSLTYLRAAVLGMNEAH